MCDLEVEKNYFLSTWKAKFLRQKFDYNYIKINYFCLIEKSMDRVNRVMTNYKKISKTDDVKIYKEFI